MTHPWPKSRGYGVLFALNRAALAYWNGLALNSREILTYLHERGWGDPRDIVRRYGLGYAPGFNDAAPGFVDKTLREGFEGIGDRETLQEALLATGLAIKSRRNGELRDLYYSRLMFPIPRTGDFETLTGPAAEIVGFGGRATPSEEARAKRADRHVPKYINTPDTVLFNKGRLLYGWPWAEKAVIRRKQIIVLEGYTDLIRVREAGIENAAACLGTAVTASHMHALDRLNAGMITVVLATDADPAGRRAAERGARVTLNAGHIARIATFEGGKDPDELIRERGEAGTEAFQAAIDEARTPVLNYLDVAADAVGGPRWGESLADLVTAFRDLNELTGTATERQLEDDARRVAMRFTELEGLPLDRSNAMDFLQHNVGDGPGEAP